MAAVSAKAVTAGIVLAICSLPNGTDDYRSTDSAPEAYAARAPAMHVVRNPYADVDWAHTLRLKTALHDHVRDKPEYLLRMDAAGYDAVPLMHYSGVASQDRIWRERHWPPVSFLPPELFAQLKSIKLLYPSAEEVGFDHITSPFLTTYIAKWEEGYYVRREPWHYGSSQEAIDLINRFGGLAFIAHPWAQPQAYTALHGFAGMELYNAYCRAKFQQGEIPTDCNENLLRSWDHVLHDRPWVVGVAVNDWFGPWRDRNAEAVGSDAWDSGKTIVLAASGTLSAFRTALEGGAVLAVKDLGEIDDRFPTVRAIEVDAHAIRIDLDPERGGSVHWVADGQPLPRPGPRLELPLDKPARYVRAEIIGADGSTTYTQAFALRRVHAARKR